jgi:hypothetical protein
VNPYITANLLETADNTNLKECEFKGTSNKTAKSIRDINVVNNELADLNSSIDSRFNNLDHDLGKAFQGIYISIAGLSFFIGFLVFGFIYLFVNL